MPGIKFIKEIKRINEDSSYNGENINFIESKKEIDLENPFIFEIKNLLP